MTTTGPARSSSAATDGTSEIEDVLVDLLAAASPNPPGDVTAATDVVTGYCDRVGLPYRVDRPAARRRNVVVEVSRSPVGRHLVWNGHLDTFPAAGPQPPVRSDGVRVHGRGAVDMKGGVAAFLVAARRLRDGEQPLPGGLTLALVCEEETFGPLGARGLLDRQPWLLGDALVSTEPSSLGLVRTAERGFLWLKVHFAGRSMHSAYPSDGGEGAILRMTSLVRSVSDMVRSVNEDLEARPRPASPEAEAMERHLGRGAARIARTVSLNVGTVAGGNAVNMQPDRCEVSLDLRLPDFVSVDELLERIRLASEELGGRVEVLGRGSANRTPSDAAIVRSVVAAAARRTGVAPELSSGLGNTDTRLWRYAGVPACVIGPSPATMGAESEYVELSELEALVDILVDSARDYLSGRS